MINVSATSVVAAHHHAHNSCSVNGNPAQSRIARDKLSNALSVVAFGDFQTFNASPKLQRRVVIVDAKFSSNDVATHLVFTIPAL